MEGACEEHEVRHARTLSLSFLEREEDIISLLS
jgi:hypothetical protein